MSFDAPKMPDGAEPLSIEYTNWRGVHGRRNILPLGIDFRSTKWHPVRQWLMKAFDFHAGAERDFAIIDFGPRVTLAGTEIIPSGWIIGGGDEEYITRNGEMAASKAADGIPVRPFYEDATIAELERIRRQLLVLAESGPHAGFAEAVLNAREVPE